jgi:hypothetical protein
MVYSDARNSVHNRMPVFEQIGISWSACGFRFAVDSLPKHQSHEGFVTHGGPLSSLALVSLSFHRSLLA